MIFENNNILVDFSVAFLLLACVAAAEPASFFLLLSPKFDFSRELASSFFSSSCLSVFLALLFLFNPKIRFLKTSFKAH